MNTLYVVHKSGGSYVNEDEYDEPVVASFDRTKCEQYVAEHQAESAEFIRLADELNKLYSSKLKDDPYGGGIEYSSPLKDKPRWPSGLKQHEITQEMRDERKQVEEYNTRLMEERSAKVQAHEEKRLVRFTEFRQRFIKFKDVPEKWHKLFLQNNFVPIDRNRRFSIKTLPMI